MQASATPQNVMRMGDMAVRTASSGWTMQRQRSVTLTIASHLIHTIRHSIRFTREGSRQRGKLY